jgi:TRAP-type transport system periplasmic protein
MLSPQGWRSRAHPMTSSDPDRYVAYRREGALLCAQSATSWGDPAVKLIRCFAGATLVLAALRVADAQETTLQIVSNLPAIHASSKAMEVFKAEVARQSRGSIQLAISAGDPRGLNELIDAVHVGSIFATWTSIGNFSRVVPEITATTLPFAFANYDEARRAVSAGPVGSLITTKLEAKGFVVLAWMELGAMHVTNSKRPLKTLDDFKDLSIRVLPNATHLATFKALGARPVAMDLKDVGAAMRQGDIDGEEQDGATSYGNKYYDSQRYLSDTAHFHEFHVLVANKKAFAQLTPAQQKAIREAAKIAAIQQSKMSTEAQAAALMGLQAKGIQFDPLSRETRLALRRATTGVIEDVSKWVGADIVNKVLMANRVSGKSGRSGQGAIGEAGHPTERD